VTVRTPRYDTCEGGTYDWGPQDGPCRVRMPGLVIDEVTVNPDGRATYTSRGIDLWSGYVYPSATCPPELRTSPFGECACPAAYVRPDGTCALPDGTVLRQDAANAFALTALLALAAGAGLLWYFGR